MFMRTGLQATVMAADGHPAVPPAGPTAGNLLREAEEHHRPAELPTAFASNSRDGQGLRAHAIRRTIQEWPCSAE